MDVIFFKTHRLSSGSSAKAPSSWSGREWSWPSGSPCKWVLACSSLSVEEKVLTLNLYLGIFILFKSFVRLLVFVEKYWDAIINLVLGKLALQHFAYLLFEVFLKNIVSDSKSVKTMTIDDCQLLQVSF